MSFCLMSKDKETLAAMLREEGLKEAAEFIENEISDCKASQKGGKKRPPSEYNIFMGNCMKGQKERGEQVSMKACAADWKASK